jgi:hypothetical protein
MTASFGANFGEHYPSVEVINPFEKCNPGAEFILAMQMGYESFFDHAWSLLFSWAKVFV